MLLYSVVLWVVLLSQLLKAEEILDVEPAVERERLRSDLRDRNRIATRRTVHVFYRLQHVLGLDERDQILSVSGILSLCWIDPSLAWDPSSYSGVTDVNLSPEDVWLPRLQPQFNVRSLSIYDKVRSPPVFVSSNGTVRWYPEVRFDVPCIADYRHYPFDRHTCSLLIVDQSIDGVFLRSSDWRSSTRPESVQGTEWALRLVVHAEDVVEQKVNVSIHLERTSRMYRYVCVVPTIIAMVTLLSGFWLLPDETTRYVIGCANVVVLSMLLQHLAATVPAGKGLPLIAQYSASCLCLSSIFVVVTVVNKLFRTTKGDAPISLVRLAHSSLDRPLCLFTFSHVSSQEQASRDPDELKRRSDWLLVSVMVDRLAFWCFAFVFAVLLVVLAAV